MPEHIGKYEILAELGKGGMGVVYKARDPLLERLVVVKTISPTLAGDESFKKRFYREARAAALLDHPNIVTIYELSEDRGVPYIAMEFLPGQSLEAMIQSRLKVSLSKQLDIISQAGQALAFAHKNGVVHRDVKPANIMRMHDGAVKVVDFGIARMSSSGSATQAGTVIGTLDYMSPEQIRGEVADARSDIFSLGVVSYELLSFHRPFAASNTAALLLKIVNETPRPIRELVSDCPPDVAAILERALAKDREHRFQNMEEMLQELQGAYLRSVGEMADLLYEDAQQCVKLRQWVAAQSLLQQILGVDPSREAARSLLSQVRVELRCESLRSQLAERMASAERLVAAKRYEAAIEECRAVLTADEPHPRARELLAHAQQALELERLAQAELEQGRNCLQAGSLTPARDVVSKILARDPENAEAQRLREAIQVQTVERQTQLRLSAQLRQAREMFERNEFREALGVLSDLDAQFPQNAEIAHWMAQARSAAEKEEVRRWTYERLQGARDLKDRRQFEEALSLLEEIRVRNPGEPAAAALQAEVWAELARLREAPSGAENARGVVVTPTVPADGVEPGQSPAALRATAVVRGRVPGEPPSGKIPATPQRTGEAAPVGRPPGRPAPAPPARASPAPLALTVSRAAEESRMGALPVRSVAVVLLLLLGYGVYRTYLQWEQGQVPAETASATGLRASPDMGALTGRVRDETGLGVPQVLVQARGVKGSEYLQVSTDWLGSYTFSNLPPGLYELFVQESGAKKPRLAASVAVRAAQTVNADLVLRRGRPRTTVRTREKSAPGASEGRVAGRQLGAPSGSSQTVPRMEAATAGNSSIEGRVVDDLGNPLVGINMKLLNSSRAVVRTTATAKNGSYRFTSLGPGGYTVSCFPPPPFVPVAIPMTEIENNMIYEMNISLSRSK